MVYNLIRVIGLIGLSGLLSGFGELRDPTLPQGLSQRGGVVINVKNLTLQAIIVSRSRRIAVLNGVFVREGDKLGNLTILKIEPNTVQLDAPQGKITLFLIKNPTRPL